jgi:superoxide dismutase, Cu-Zn family
MQNYPGTPGIIFLGGTVRRITKAALGGLAGCALVIGGTQLASGDSPHVAYTWSGPLADLRPHVSGGPLDGATASVRVIEAPEEGIAFKVQVRDVNLSTTNPQFGAHLHVGPCTERKVLSTEPLPVLSPDTTGAHYTVPGEPVSADSEVWFDFEPDPQAVATDETTVMFVIKDKIDPLLGDMSIVLHEKVTAPDGTAGAREACLPVNVLDWV